MLKSNEIIGVTESITDFTFENVLYKSNSNTKAKINNSNVVLNIEQLLPNEIALGKLDGALIKTFIFDYKKSAEIYEVSSGILSKVTVANGNFFFDVIPRIKTLNANVCNYYSRTCRANFCDKNCNLDKKNFSYEGEVTMFEQNKIHSDLFSQYENGFFNAAFIEINNIKYKVDIHKNNYVRIKFFNHNIISKGLKFLIYLECDKEFNTCKNKYNNALNFRGEPFLKN